MVRFINRLTGSLMWIHESRVEEYKAAGHVPAADLEEDLDLLEEEIPEKPKKRTSKKG